jgi:hypothetical protein
VHPGMAASPTRIVYSVAMPASEHDAQNVKPRLVRGSQPVREAHNAGVAAALGGTSQGRSR